MGLGGWGGGRVQFQMIFQGRKTSQPEESTEKFSFLLDFPVSNYMYSLEKAIFLFLAWMNW